MKVTCVGVGVFLLGQQPVEKVVVCLNSGSRGHLLLWLSGVWNTETAVNKAHQPDRADQQELNILKKGWFLAFNIMTNELHNPQHHKRQCAYKASNV